MSTLVIADHDGKNIHGSTLSVVTAASKLGKEVTLLVAGNDCADAAAAGAKISGVNNVLVASDASLATGLSENLAPFLQKCQAEKGFTHVLASAGPLGKGVIPRLGALLDVQPLSEIIEVQSEDTFVRPIYAGNALATVKSNDKVKLMTVRPTAFEKAGEQAAAPISDFDAAGSDTGLTQFLGAEITKSDRPDLASANVVVSGGRALKSAENFSIMYDLADKMNAAVGASRAAVDAGYVANDLQIGQTGKVVAPGLYFAIGISGAIQHLAGMKDSKIIVAINKDPEAPIFSVADYGLVGDLFTVCPEITKAL
jgi:electron transfer flavoprotein alpha subunit